MYAAQDNRVTQKIVGFLLGPALGLALNRSVHTTSKPGQTLGYAGAGLAAYYGSENLTNLEVQALLRGAMWGNAAAAVITLLR